MHSMSCRPRSSCPEPACKLVGLFPMLHETSPDYLTLFPVRYAFTRGLIGPCTMCSTLHEAFLIRVCLNFFTHPTGLCLSCSTHPTELACSPTDSAFNSERATRSTVQPCLCIARLVLGRPDSSCKDPSGPYATRLARRAYASVQGRNLLKNS